MSLSSSRSIAVLPFVNMSASEENEYFSDGITEEIINALAKINGLKVTSRTSAFQFKGKNMSMTEIGNTLGVSTLLEGSVRLSGNAMRITAQLIDAAEDFHFWSETWDRNLDNIFEVQDEISLLIAEKLREHFGHLEIQEHLVEQNDSNVEAHKLFLKGRQFLNKWNPSDALRAIEFYHETLNIEPKHAEAMLGLADAYSFLATVAVIPFEEGWSKCAVLTSKAMEINDQLPDAYYQLANIAFFTKFNYREAFEHTLRAVQLNANHVRSQQFMTFLFIIAGKTNDARKHLNHALSIDPLSQETKFYSAYVAYMSRDFLTALDELNACLEANPMNIPVHAVKTLCFLKMGHYDEAITYWDALPSEIVVPGEHMGTQALGFALKNDSKNARRLKNVLVDLAKEPEGFTADSYLFMLAAATGQYDEAFDWVANAIANGSPLLLLRYGDPLVELIKDDSRYATFHDQLYPPELFGGQEKSTKKKALLDHDSAVASKSKLQKLIQEESPYLNPDLSLRQLAGQLELHHNQLSWLLNTEFGKNFNEFINHYRIKAFKQVARLPENANMTIVALAYDCGFNSKTVFNTYFKKETGTTPKQFLKR